MLRQFITGTTVLARAFDHFLVFSTDQSVCENLTPA